MSDPSEQYAAPGPRSELAWLPVGRLKIDPVYQRDITSIRSQRLIAKIAREFSWRRFGVIVAVADGAEWFVLDGQHRTEAARLREDIAELPAVVQVGVTQADAARDFVAINQDRARMSPLQVYKALLAHGDAVAVSVDAATRAAGLEVLAYAIKAENMKPCQTLAIGALRQVESFYAEGFLERLCRVLTAAYPDEPGAIRADLIKAAAVVLYSQMNTAQLRQALARRPASDLCLAAARRREPGEAMRDALIAEITGKPAATVQVPEPARTTPAAADPEPVRGDGPVSADDLAAAKRGLGSMGFELEAVGDGRFRIGVAKYTPAELIRFHNRMADASAPSKWAGGRPKSGPFSGRGA